jgi:hypothetical protein
MYFVNSFVTIFKMKFENFKGIKRDFFIRKKKTRKSNSTKRGNINYILTWNIKREEMRKPLVKFIYF